MDSKNKAQLAAKFAKEKKAENLVILDMREVSNFCDFFLICAGSSLRRVKSIAQSIEEGLEEYSIRVDHIEGEDGESGWILLDYADIIVHVFLEPLREFYDLERLWADAPRLDCV